jgi:hypothetical protein
MKSTNTENTILIVDFPHQPRTPSTVNTLPVKSVHLASQVEGRYIKYPSAIENQAKWYNKQDYVNFKRDMLRDVMKCSAAMATVQDRQVAQEHLVRCVGIDHLISRDIPQRYQAIKEGRKEHIRLVLQEQDRQRREGVNKPEQLSKVSFRSSIYSRERSHRVAMACVI